MVMKNNLNIQYFENLFKFSNGLIIIWDKDLNITHFNPAFEKLTGRKEKSLLGKSIEILFPESKVHSTMQLIRNAETGCCLEGTETEIEIIHENGFVNTVIWNSALVLDDDGKTIVATIAQGLDITERKLTEKKLERLNLQKELILNSVAEGVLGLDIQGKHTFVNPAAAKMLGYETKELIGLPSHSLWHHTKTDGSSYPQEECPIYEAFRDGKVHRVSSEVFWKKDGSCFPVEFASMPIYEMGKLIGAVVTFTDITERKKTEEALTRSEQRMNAFVNDSLLCIYFFNTETKNIIYANPSFYKLLGYSPKEIDTITIYDFLNHAKESVDEFVNHVIQTKQRNIGERQWKKKDGEVIEMFVNASHGDHINSKILYISAQNISESKRAEKELLLSEHFLKESQKVSKIGSYVLDISIGKWKCTEELGKIFGLSAEDEYSFEEWVALIHPDHQKMMIDYFEFEVVGKKSRFDKEYKIINQKTKKELWVNGIGEMEFDHNNVPIKMVGTIQDITERKETQQKIIDSEKKFRSVLQSAKDSIVLANGKGEIIFWNYFAEKIFGYKENEVLGKLLTFIMPERYRTDHHHSFEQHVSTNQEQVFDKTVEFYGLKKNGKEFPIELSLSHWTNENEKFYCGIIRDITERKNAEEEQKMHIKRLSEIAFLQSHHVRAPIASILGLLQLINYENPADEKNSEVFYHLKKTSEMCDVVIKEIIQKTSEIEELNKKC